MKLLWGVMSLLLPLAVVSAELPVRIFLPKSPKPYEVRAARELSGYLRRLGLKSMSLKGEVCSSIHVGCTDFASRHGISGEALENEQWVVKSFGPQLVLIGGGTRGTLYAVSHFLEDCCGVRWWSQIEEDVPTRETLALDELDLKGKPAFPERDIYAAVSETNASEIACRLRLNGLYSGSGKDPEGFGGWVRVGSPKHCHTHDHYIPAKDYLATHPEWFSYDRKEKRRRGGSLDGQLCWTNPEVREEMKRRLRAYIAADREKAEKAGVAPPTVYEISENDNTHYCECPDCLAAREKWNLSGLDLDFVNDIASSIKDDYPEVFVRTFAYLGTEDPPKGGKRAADNVIVRLCNTRSNRIAGLREKGNTAFADFLTAWSKVAKVLAVWDYSITFTKKHCGFPLPSEFYYGEYFRMCRDAGVRGFFWEHENPWKADMWELKYFLETKLMEDPSLDVDALIVRFMREYYGPACADVLAYRRWLDSLRREKGGCVKWFPQLSNFNWIGDGEIAEMQTLLAGAESVTGGAEPWLSRVRRVRLGLDRLLCQRELVRAGGISSDAGRAAEARIRSFWPTWAAHFQSLPASTVSKAIEQELSKNVQTKKE